MASRIIAFDVETPNHRNDRICSIGLSIIEDGIVTNTKTLLVNPECEFDKRNIEIHGITPEVVADAPSFNVIWNDIGELFRTNLVVAHNATFDLCVLKKTLAAYEIIEPFIYFVCTQKIAAAVLHGIENYKLPTLCNYYGIALSHHDAGSDSHACAEILCRLMASGIDLNNFIASYSFESKTPSPRQLHRRESSRTHALHELSNILNAISNDGILSVSELEYLQDWLNSNSDLRGNYPYDKIYQTLTTVLADGVADRDEIDLILILFQKVSDPVNETSCTCCGLNIDGKRICLSGDFDRGSKSEIEGRLVSCGATVLNSVSKKIDILIVGGKGSSAWSAGNYGTKIKKALELQEKGGEIIIVREDDFFAMLEE